MDFYPQTPFWLSPPSEVIQSPPVSLQGLKGDLYNRIRKLLSDNPDTSYSTEEILQHIPHNQDSLTNALYLLSKRGIVLREGERPKNMTPGYWRRYRINKSNNTTKI
jgi:hypothetical protein